MYGGVGLLTVCKGRAGIPRRSVRVDESEAVSLALGGSVATGEDGWVQANMEVGSMLELLSHGVRVS